MKKFIIQIILIIIVLSIIIIGIMYLVKKQDPKTELENNYENFKEESTMYDENATIDDLKEEYNIEGNSELYEIQTEYDGRKVLAIKASENYKVAFAGLIKKSKPTFEEATKIFEEQYPKQAGIWIEPESRQIILNYLNNNLNSSYEIEENGGNNWLRNKEGNKVIIYIPENKDNHINENEIFNSILKLVQI